MKMREGDWQTWVTEHKAILGMSGPVAADLFGAWKPYLANATLEELRGCTAFIVGSVERAKLPWATHLAMIREWLHEERQHKKKDWTGKGKAQPPIVAGDVAAAFAKRTADRQKSQSRQYPDGVSEILDGIGNEEDAKLPREDDPLNA